MKISKRIFLSLIAGCLATLTATAGNPDRAGQAGAAELLINPWAFSAGLNSINISSVTGIDAMRINPGGLAFLKNTVVSFSRTEYLVGSDMNVSALGFGTKVGEGAIGLSVVSFGFGEIEVTTVNQPEGGLGVFRPQFLNIGLGYSRNFADFIHGGVVVRLVSEQIEDVGATGLALDAGLVYNTGPDSYPEKFKFGVALRNVGTPMTFRGDGLTFKTLALDNEYQITVSERSQQFELPTQLAIGASYDMYFSGRHRLTAVGSFISNAFNKDNFGLGFEYGLKVANNEMFMLRAGYRYEDGLLFDTVNRTTAHTGLAGGFTFEYPFNKDEENSPRVALDYSYRTSDPFNGSHAVGVRIGF